MIPIIYIYIYHVFMHIPNYYVLTKETICTISVHLAQQQSANI